jgi:hypothetical protein
LRSSGGRIAPQEMPPKRRCGSQCESSELCAVVAIAADSEMRKLSGSFPDSLLAARMFDSWQYYMSDDDDDDEEEEEEEVTNRTGNPAFVANTVESHESAAPSNVPDGLGEPSMVCDHRGPPSFSSVDLLLRRSVADSSTGSLGPVSMDDDDDYDDEAKDDDDDEDDTSSVVSWEFWPRRTSLRSLNGNDNDDAEGGGLFIPGDDTVFRRDLLNVDRFMASLLLSDDSDIDVDGNDDAEHE